MVCCLCGFGKAKLWSFFFSFKSWHLKVAAKVKSTHIITITIHTIVLTIFTSISIRIIITITVRVLSTKFLS